MAVSSGTSFILSSIMSVLLFSGMQTYRPWLASTQVHTLLGGFLGSLLFMLVLTAFGNIESVVFGKSFQTKLFPEVILCMFLSMFAAGMVHRVCATTCLLFSILALYFINQISQKTHVTPVPVTAQPIKKKNK